MNMPEPSSNPATRVRRGITLKYQWKYFTPTHSAGAVRTVRLKSGSFSPKYSFASSVRRTRPKSAISWALMSPKLAMWRRG